jgi:hypothetical protein
LCVALCLPPPPLPQDRVQRGLLLASVRRDPATGHCHYADLVDLLLQADPLPTSVGPRPVLQPPRPPNAHRRVQAPGGPGGAAAQRAGGHVTGGGAGGGALQGAPRRAWGSAHHHPPAATSTLPRGAGAKSAAEGFRGPGSGSSGLRVDGRLLHGGGP